MSAAHFAFQACSFNHSDISPSLESTTCERSQMIMTHADLVPMSSEELLWMQLVEGYVAVVRLENCVRPLNVPRPLAGIPRWPRRRDRRPFGRPAVRGYDGAPEHQAPLPNALLARCLDRQSSALEPMDVDTYGVRVRPTFSAVCRQQSPWPLLLAVARPARARSRGTSAGRPAGRRERRPRGGVPHNERPRL